MADVQTPTANPAKRPPRSAADSHSQAFYQAWQQWLPSFEQQLEQFLHAALSNPDQDAGLQQLSEAICYSSLDGGKRMRPLLVNLVARCAADANTQRANDPLTERAAIAIELIHCYSLIHDDLPAMDDDALRRGRPTCHKRFDEATAILAGDALQTLAFECLSSAESADPGLQLELLRTLSRAAGAHGMVGGQAMDIAAEQKQINIEQLTTLHRLKTGQLINAAVGMGALTGGASDVQRDALADYGDNIGLAFQVRDDIIDITSSSDVLGKPQGADQAANKSTFPSLLGLDGARAAAEQHYAKALAALENFGPEADLLRGLAAFFVDRDR